MIFKNPSSANDFFDKLMPKTDVEGFLYYDAIAIEATTARMIGALHPSASGWVFDGFQTHAATGTTKPAVCMDAVASGSLTRCAIQGFVEGVNISGTGTVTTGYSTFTRGHAVYLTDTGHLINSGATWVDIYNRVVTGESTAASVVGIAMSSGVTATVDLYLLGKPYIYCAAT